MSDLSKIYKDRFEQTGLLRRDRVWKVLCKHFFDQKIPQNATVLDLACGYGEFINNVKATRKLAVDLNPDAPKYLNPEVSFWNSMATDLSVVGREVADVVFTSNFLEHLRDKKECDTVLTAVREVLKPGGRFIIMGPNIRYAYKEYWDFYDHYLPLSHLSLAEGLRIAGFRIEENIPRFMPYTMNNNAPTNDFFVRAYLRMPLAWKLLGKQFLVTAVK
ncbi:class I SAM-dependent methyltransferase [Rhizobium sp. BK399]|uniref:class I SAM-dependent methyltransferase n=1 Tax=Rhizobium sp. BK399 TaxID=2587063 RepID=UPI0016227014|nr:class I SAM-dependent methyltransferase [Rhizobium sp. BK399]MBB3542454.1 ubiquinone/menaquinone biosynthesis C-methylase UbiE [Rhizobium sp. BK399]